MERNGAVRIWTKERRKASITYEFIRLALLALVAIILLHSMIRVSLKLSVTDNHI